MIAPTLLWLAAACPQSDQAGWSDTLYTVPLPEPKLALRDLDGDGLADLLAIDAAGVTAHFQRADGGFPPSPDASLPWPGSKVAWDLVDIDRDGRFELCLLIDGGTVRMVTASASEEGWAFDPGRTLLENAGAFLPRGVWRTTFVRDVDADGKGDLVVPGAGLFRIHLQREELRFAAPFEVGFESEIVYEMGDPGGLGQRFGETVRVPFFRLEDADGDGRRDLLATTEDAVHVHLADPELSAEPTWTLDLRGLRDEIERRRKIDLDDLFSNVTPTVTWKLADVDGVAPTDLVVQQAGTFKIYLGGGREGMGRTPDALLKASGNVMHFMLRDVMGDERPELQIIRAEKISLGTAVRWLVLPGSLEFDVFTYANEGGKISRKPAKRTTLSLEVPRLLSLADEIEGIEEELEERGRVPARALCLDGDGQTNDVVDIDAGQVVFYFDLLPEGYEDVSLARFFEGDTPDVEQAIAAFVQTELDPLEDGETRSIGLDDLRSISPSPGHDLRTLHEGERPDDVHALRLDHEQRVTILTPDLDGDGASDVVLIGKDGEGRVTVQILVRRGD